MKTLLTAIALCLIAVPANAQMMACAKDRLNVREGVWSLYPAQTLRNWPLLQRPIRYTMFAGECEPIKANPLNYFRQDGYTWINVMSGWVASEFVDIKTKQEAYGQK